MSKKRYTVRYFRDGKPVITAISNYMELAELILGDAKNSCIETKVSENMPKVLHDTIAHHNHQMQKP